MSFLLFFSLHRIVQCKNRLWGRQQESICACHDICHLAHIHLSDNFIYLNDARGLYSATLNDTTFPGIKARIKGTPCVVICIAMRRWIGKGIFFFYIKSRFVYSI